MAQPDPTGTAHVKYEESTTGGKILHPVIIYSDTTKKNWVGKQDITIGGPGDKTIRLNDHKHGPGFTKDGEKFRVGFKPAISGDIVWDKKTELTYHSDGTTAEFEYIWTLADGAECQYMGNK